MGRKQVSLWVSGPLWVGKGRAMLLGARATVVDSCLVFREARRGR